MHGKDEELLERLAKKTEKEGLEFENCDPVMFRRLIEQLIEKSSSPKQWRQGEERARKQPRQAKTKRK